MEQSVKEESSEYLRFKEMHEFYKKRVDKLQSRRGYLSYEETMELKKLKKLKLATKDEMERLSKC